MSRAAWAMDAEASDSNLNETEVCHAVCTKEFTKSNFKQCFFMPEAEVNFTLDSDTLARVRKAAGVLGHSELSISNTQGAVRLSIADISNATSNLFSIDVEGTYPEGVDFNFIMNVNNLKVIDEDFHVAISSKLISQFTSTQSDIEYFIALEKSSTYGA